VNLERARWQQADAVARAALIQSAAELPRAYFDAVCPLPEQVDDAHWGENADRMTWRVMHKKKGGAAPWEDLGPPPAPGEGNGRPGH